MTVPSRRDALAAAGLGITTLTLPRAAAHATDLTPQVADTASLVLHLDAGSTASYPGTGTTWTDLSAAGNDVTWVADAAAPSWDPDGWFTFDGGDRLEVGAILTAGSAYTVEAWVWDTSGGTGSRNIISSSSDVLFLNGTTLHGGTGRSYLVTESPGFPTATWQHVAFTVDPDTTTVRLFREGTQVDVATRSGGSAGEVLYIGAHVATSLWNGRIAEVRVYASALTAAQVAANRLTTAGRYAD